MWCESDGTNACLLHPQIQLPLPSGVKLDHIRVRVIGLQLKAIEVKRLVDALDEGSAWGGEGGKRSAAPIMHVNRVVQCLVYFEKNEGGGDVLRDAARQRGRV